MGLWLPASSIPGCTASASDSFCPALLLHLTLLSYPSATHTRHLCHQKTGLCNLWIPDGSPGCAQTSPTVGQQRNMANGWGHLPGDSVSSFASLKKPIAVQAVGFVSKHLKARAPSRLHSVTWPSWPLSTDLGNKLPRPCRAFPRGMA